MQVGQPTVLSVLLAAAALVTSRAVGQQTGEAPSPTASAAIVAPLQHILLSLRHRRWGQQQAVAGKPLGCAGWHQELGGSSLGSPSCVLVLQYSAVLIAGNFKWISVLKVDLVQLPQQIMFLVGSRFLFLQFLTSSMSMWPDISLSARFVSASGTTFQWLTFVSVYFWGLSSHPYQVISDFFFSLKILRWPCMIGISLWVLLCLNTSTVATLQ